MQSIMVGVQETWCLVQKNWQWVQATGIKPFFLKGCYSSFHTFKGQKSWYGNKVLKVTIKIEIVTDKSIIVTNK
ncbi:hypothetical protein OXB_3399 [Bacillus sp. OxB-1]|nr:hypothetical protein OXB_3399 [Bacillus sp. OxB-1]